MSRNRIAATTLALAAAVSLSAQSPRITQRIDNTRTIRLARSTHPLTTRARDLGRAPASLPVERVTLLLSGGPQQEAALEQWLASQHDPTSPDFQHWLTPEEFGERFGASPSDLDTVSRWLETQGFRVDAVARGRRSLEISGTVEAVERAFHTEVRHYEWDGERHTANARELSIPRALAGVVTGVLSLHDFHARPQHAGSPVPLANLSGGHALSPYDFAAIYNVAPLWNQGFDGTGQSIAVAGRSNIRSSDAATFRAWAGLPANPPQVILNGPDPGILNSNEEFEADLDVQWSGAIAKGAAIKFVVSKSTISTDGIALSSQYIVNNNVAPIVSVSFGNCEDYLGMDTVFYHSLWQQAAAQGMSVFVATGDSGSAGCDAAWGGPPSAHGFGINGIGSSPYSVAVGGTQFTDGANPAAYWNASVDSKQASARGYIPETVWNESSSTSPLAGGGGYSMFFVTPAWQAGAGFPTWGSRYTPDVSLASAGHTGYIVVRDGSIYLMAGTSAAAPSLAGIMAIVDQYSGKRNGNPNPRLYPMATQFPNVFHDVTTGTNAVPCKGGTNGCSTGAGTVGVTQGFNATTGYDLASGLGSVDAYALAVNWSAPAPVPPAITALNPNPLQPSDAMQALAILGSGFTTGATVTAGYPGYSVTLPVNGLLPGRIGTAITVGQTARTWTIKVTNPNGLSTSTSLVVPAVTPNITALTPNPMTVSAATQPLSINGTGFQPGAKVILSYPGFSQTFTTQVVVASARLITVPVNVGTVARTWTVQVVNASGITSAPFNLTVRNTPAAPVISSINPTAMTLSTSAQTLTINGSGFATSGTLILLMSPTYSVLVPVTTATSTQLTASYVPGTVARDFQVQVLNPGGIGSNLVNLTIR